MSGPADCEILGRWRIVKSNAWEDGYLDLVGPATIHFEADGHGQIAFGCVQADLDLEYGRTIVFFRWAGFDEGNEITGSGSAELIEDHSLEIELSFDHGDDATLIARRQ